MHCRFYQLRQSLPVLIHQNKNCDQLWQRYTTACVLSLVTGEYVRF